MVAVAVPWYSFSARPPRKNAFLRHAHKLNPINMEVHSEIISDSDDVICAGFDVQNYQYFCQSS